MTREEAIAKIGEQYKICQEFYNLSANPQKDYPGVTAYMEALDTALSALRPISREQVEKVFPGCQSCKSCRKRNGRKSRGWIRPESVKEWKLDGRRSGYYPQFQKSICAKRQHIKRKILSAGAVKTRCRTT